MINCIYIEENEFESFKLITEEKQNPRKKRLEDIQNRVNSSYIQYLNDFNSLEFKPSSEFTNNNEKEALNYCYSSSSGAFRIQRATIFNKQPDFLKTLCPYCLLDKPKTLDHYIGQSEFPEYSVLIKNLIPCCYDCNQIKAEHWRRNNRRRFIHFYNDTFLNNNFLKANLNYLNGETPSIEYYLEKPNTMNNEDYQIVIWHFEDLNLINQYNKRSNSFVSTHIETMINSYRRGNSKHNILSEYIDKHNSYSLKFGVNFWETVMYETLANSIDNIIN